MAVSAAKLEANRRNAQQSTGPRTQEGKNRSKFNALDHGCRARSLILPDEDPQVLNDRRDAWFAHFGPRDQPEAYFLEDAVVSSWHLDRARRAQAARLTTNILNHGIERELAVEVEVAELGRRLFKDRQGPLVLYPSPTLTERLDYDRDPSTSYAGKKDDDAADRPAELVLRLQATLKGCEWLLGEWAALQAILDRGQPWLSSDKLKAVRLLGRQPFDALDDRDVAIIFLASFVLKPDKRTWYWEIATELAEKDMRRFLSKAATRELESLLPGDAAAARDVLAELIGRAIERLMLKAEAHRERARIEASLAADRLAFDESRAGEQLRRYELACGRAMSRSLDKMLKLRDVSGPLSVVSGPLSVENRQPQEVDAPNEPTAAGENTTNEPTARPSCVVGDPLSDGHCEVAAAGDGNAGPNGYAEIDIEKTSEWIRKELEKRQALRAQRLAKLNEQARRERETARAARRSRAGSPKAHQGKAGGKAPGPKPRAGQSRKRETAAREKRELESLLSTLRGTPAKARADRN